MTYSWDRNSGTTGTTSGMLTVLGGRALSGQSIRRVTLGWSLCLFAPAWTVERLIGRPAFFGAWTVRSTYAGPNLDPSASPLLEQSYPSERWLWYEASPLVAEGRVDYTNLDGHHTLRTVGTESPKDVETSVKNIYPGEDLFVNLTVSCPALPAMAIEGWAFAYASVLRQ